MSSSSKNYRLDRTAFKIRSFEEADNYMRKAKKEAGRLKDLDDIEQLTKE